MDYTPDVSRRDLAQNTDLDVNQQTYAPWVAVAMLLTTLVAAALAIYFGHQAWDAGLNFSGNIPNLMASIPFDVTFLIGCASAVVGVAATIYSIWHYCKNNNDAESEPSIPRTPELEEYEAVVRKVNIIVGKGIQAQKQDHEIEIEPEVVGQLVANQTYFLHFLPEIPGRVVELVIQEIFKKGIKEFIEETLRTIESWTSKIENNKLTLDERRNLCGLQENLRKIYSTLSKLENIALVTKIHNLLLMVDIDLSTPPNLELLRVGVDPSHTLWRLKGMQEIYQVLATFEGDEEAFIVEAKECIAAWTEITNMPAGLGLAKLQQSLLAILVDLKKQDGLLQLGQIGNIKVAVQNLSDKVTKKFGSKAK